MQLELARITATFIKAVIIELAKEVVKNFGK